VARTRKAAPEKAIPPPSVPAKVEAPAPVRVTFRPEMFPLPERTVYDNGVIATATVQRQGNHPVEICVPLESIDGRYTGVAKLKLTLPAGDAVPVFEVSGDVVVKLA
jgi:hypothetical protein